MCDDEYEFGSYDIGYDAGYGTGYDRGYDSGRDSREWEIDDLNEEITKLREKVDYLTEILRANVNEK